MIRENKLMYIDIEVMFFVCIMVIVDNISNIQFRYMSNPLVITRQVSSTLHEINLKNYLNLPPKQTFTSMYKGSWIDRA